MLKKIELLILIVLITGCFSACKFTLPTSSKLSDAEAENAVKAVWSPYVGIHPFDPNTQQPHLQKLINAGALRGARVELRIDINTSSFIDWLQSSGVEVLGHFWSGYVDWWNRGTISTGGFLEIFDQTVRQYPGVRVWQMGGELTGWKVSPEKAMELFKALFHHVKQNYPWIILVSPATAGNGSSADDLRRMIDAGLDKLCQEGLEIVSIHFYSWNSTRLAEFQSQVARLTISTRIWITETNDFPPNWSTQTGYVAEMYPKLRSALRAERIYWYVFSEGRNFHNGEFGLVKGLADYPPVEYSPLMNLLIGAGNTNLSVSDAALDNFGVSPEILPDMTPRLPPGMNRDADKPSRHNPRERRSQ